MDFEEQKRILSQQQLGFAMLRKFEIEEMRKATFHDRLNAFCRVMGLVEHLNKPDSRTDDDILANRWRDIRRRYDTRS